MEHTYTPRGICPYLIEFDVEDDKVKNVRFSGGCNGNLQAIATLVDGMPVSEVTEKLSGIRCGHKQTSCADQLAQALKALSE